MLASPWYTNRQSGFAGRRLGWGQFIRWLSPAVEDNHYHRHVGAVAGRPHDDVAAVDRLAAVDRRPRRRRAQRGDRPAERGDEGAVRDAGLRVHGARRRAERRRALGAQAQGLRDAAAVRQAGRACRTATGTRRAGSRRRRSSTSPATAGPRSSRRSPTGSSTRSAPTGKRLWRYDYAHGAAKTFASEVVAADLNRDGTPELVFGTYALRAGSGRLVVLSAAGKLLYDVRLPHQGRDGNGIGVPAAPSIGDLDGDGRLEIVLTTFDHGIDVFRVPGSGTNCLPWPTGRGNLLRNGTGSATAR